MTSPRNTAKLALLVVASTLLALGACKQEESPSQKAAAGAKILPRSVGDDMLPYDTARSQSPLAEPAAATAPSGRSARGTASEAATVDDTAADAAAAAADVEAATTE
ncbi:MAG: hypothetical protein K0R64_314 [Novosphingobium lindaniclasticum]|jgi:hypothetical protein|uniref:hypothetical protein n=1 Tax=Novosphingobium lindaniclasticum TaxID=1329895 RepID=UPI00240A01F6|nr:hypothetical protein [Novosphingobium lindaniclasticum]MDF2637330.1 hypothetical protein [Novosphingobium lindaniclasticum]